MKYLTGIICFAFMLLINGCIEDLSEDPTSFIKIYGKESNSNGLDVIELKDGGFMIAGSVSVTAYDRTNVRGNTEIGKLFESSPALIKINERGKQEIMRMYPFESFETHSSVRSMDLSETGTFLQVIENEDGSFFASGEWKYPDISLASPWNFSQDESNPMNISLPFLVKVSADMEVEKFFNFNLDKEWDLLFRGGMTLKKFPDGDLAILFHFFARPENFYPTGYEVWKIDRQGNVVFKVRHERSSGFKFARDFDIDSDGNIVMIGQRNKTIVLYRFPLDDKENEEMSELDTDGVFSSSFNDNPSYILALDDGGYAITYTNPIDIVWFATIDKDLQVINKVDITGESSNEYPRAFERTSDGNFLIYNVFLQDGGFTSTGFVYKVTQDGTVIYKKPFAGSPGTIAEAVDGDILVLSNPIYNGDLQKMRLTKMSGDGTMD